VTWQQINYFFRNQHETKILFRSSSSNWDNELCHDTQINHEMKKAYFQIVLCQTCKLQRKSHLSNVTFQWDHLSCLVCHLNQEEAKRIIFFHFWNIDRMIDHRINHIFDEKTSFEVEFNNHFYAFAFVLIWLISWCCFILLSALNSESKHIKHCVNLDSQRSKASFRAMLSSRLFWLFRSFDHEMHGKCHRFAASFKISIIQENDEWFKSKKMNKNHEKRKHLSFDQQNLNIDQFF
jgi:hypothetical protein